MNNISVVLICDVVTFPEIRNMYATRFSSDAQSCACVNSNYSILNPLVSCGEFHADILTNLEHNQHEPVTLNLESSRTRHSPQTRGCNQTLLTYLKILICSVCSVDCRRQGHCFQRNQFDFICNVLYVRINARITQNRVIFSGKHPVLWLNSCFVAWYWRIAYTCNR